MKFLITGSSGFIGKYVRRCLPKDITLLCIDPPQYNLHDRATIHRIIKEFQPTHCLHLAWSAGKGYANAVENMAWVDTSLNLIQLFYTHGGKRFVGVGSCFEYGPTEQRCNEQTTPTQPATLYGKAKLTLANYLQAYATAHDLSWAWCRPFYIAGPGEPQHRLVPAACIALAKGEDFTITSPQNILDYMDIRDVSGALVKVLLSDFCGNINIGSGEGTSVLELLQALHAIVGGRGQVVNDDEAKTTVQIIADVTVLKEQLAFAGQYTMHETLTACHTYWSTK